MKSIIFQSLFSGLFAIACFADHPAYRVQSIKTEPGKDPQVGGLDILPNGRIAAAFHDGEIRVYDPESQQWSLFAEGLHEPLGLLAENDNTITVVQRPEMTRISDTDGDGKADLYETICDDFGMSGNYHEFAFGPVKDAEGNYFISLNVASNGAPIRKEIRGKWLELGLPRDKFYASRDEWKDGLKKKAGRMYSRVPYRGWVVKVDGKTGEMIPWASGLRSPNGLAFDSNGKLFVSDNQGDWLGTSKLYHIQKDHFYGHPASLPWKNGYTGAASVDLKAEELESLRTPAAVWFTQSTMANSPTQPILIPKGFGPFEGQMLIGEMNKSRIIRLMLEEVNGVTQGACTPLIDGNGLDMGINRLVFDGDANLIVGHSHLSWPGGEGMAKVSFHGEGKYQDVKAIHVTSDGFEIEFLQAIEDQSALAQIKLNRYTFDYHSDYGSSQIDKEDLKISLTPGDDTNKRFQVDLSVPHKQDFCYEFTLPMCTNSLLCYTVRQIPGGFQSVESKDTPAKNYDWVDLLGDDNLELWRNGSKTSRNKHPEVGNLWVVRDGVLSLDKSKDGRGGHIITKKDSYFDFELKFEFMISKEGNSGVKYRVNEQTVGLEYQVYDDATSKVPKNSVASLYNLKAPSADKKVNTPGKEWNSGRIMAVGNSIQHWLNGEVVMEIEFDSPEWKETFQKSKYKEEEGFARSPGPILLQDHGSNVKYRNLRIREIMPTE